MRTIKELWEKYTGYKALVLGNGLSVNNFKKLDNTIVIGVNDINKLLDVDYHLLVDTSSRFSKERLMSVQESKAKIFITQINRGWIFPKDQHFMFKLGSYGSFTNLGPNIHLDYGLDSPYIGAILAYQMGIKKIGFLGVDYTNGHFYAPEDGEHQLVKAKRLEEVKRLYGLLGKEMKQRFTDIYNLNENSKIDTIPHMSIDTFDKLKP